RRPDAVQQRGGFAPGHDWASRLRGWDSIPLEARAGAGAARHPRSIFPVADDLAAGPRAEGRERRVLDRIPDEVDRAVREEDVGPTGVEGVNLVIVGTVHHARPHPLPRTGDERVGAIEGQLVIRRGPAAAVAKPLRLAAHPPQLG